MNDSAKENTFTDEVRKFQTSDPAHADLFNDVNTSLLGNDIYLKEHLDNLENPPTEKIPVPEELEEIKDGDSYNVMLGKLIKAVNVLLDIGEQVAKIQDTAFDEAAKRENIVSGEELQVILGKIRKWFSDLKNVAFTGSYSDLSNKPVIPSVGNGTVTITQNGVNKGSFSMNQSGNATIALSDTNTDTNTWRGIQDNLTSRSTTDSLSANMGWHLANGWARDDSKMPSNDWHWEGQGGQPSWLWGGNEYNNYYVYNPANFNVNSAVNDSAGRKIVDTYATKSELASVGASSGGVSSVHGDVQVQNGLWYKVGRMVVFTIQYYVSAEELGSGTNIITGLPTPLGGHWYGVSGARIDAYAIDNGVLSIQNNRSTGSYHVSGSYIC